MAYAVMVRSSGVGSGWLFLTPPMLPGGAAGVDYLGGHDGGRTVKRLRAAHTWTTGQGITQRARFISSSTRAASGSVISHRSMSPLTLKNGSSVARATLAFETPDRPSGQQWQC
ncbi:hypothetical protein GCM10010298_53740 [Streptomyces microflavus]|uniref:Uncharacterized protein n=1 Tax=Streptomyces microflavus TaxID=1919 RepID=A0A7J0CW70_STRMI|nr:hypothetical protein Smic_52390 [Streptomyces microflavus]GGX81570.1 hypothetical protein GCM10010298_53740 [Streptomyces microflavus]